MSVADDKFADLDFEDLQAAVESSPKGRWFLEEYARRMRAHDTGSILEAIAKLERVITDNGPVAVQPLPEPQLRQHQLKYFKQDEELFVEAKAAPTVTVVETAPQAVEPQVPAPEPQVEEPKPEVRTAHTPEMRGARLKIMRASSPTILDTNGLPVIQTAQAAPAIPDLDIVPDAAPAQAQTPAPQMPSAPQMPPAPAQPLFGERKQRIVITRKVAAEEPVIPLVDDTPAASAD